MVAAALEIQEQWEAERKFLGEDLMLDAPPIFALGNVFLVDETFPHT